MEKKDVAVAIVASVVLSMVGMVALVTLDTPLREILIGPEGPKGSQGIPGEIGPQGPIGPFYNDTKQWHWVYSFGEEEPWLRELVQDSDIFDLPDLDQIIYTSEVFEVRGRELRLRWDAEPVLIGSWIHINVVYANGTRYAYRSSSGNSALSGDMRITEPGNYFLQVYTFRMAQFGVTVWDYY